MGIYISAAHKSSGKTTLSIGLSAALSHLGHNVQTFKRGPDYIDPIWLAQASGKPCYNLDFYTMSHEEILQSLVEHPADIQIVEGNKGLFDGLSPDGTDSNAALANLLNLPVVLVVDCIGITRGIAPLLQGYQQFKHPQANIAGVILNKVGGTRHESKLRAAVENYTDIPVLGAVHKNPQLMITERHLGLIPSNEVGETTALIHAMRDAVLDSVNVEQIMKVSGTPTLTSASNTDILLSPSVSSTPSLKIAVAQDEAFGFYYANDLDTFTKLGAEIIAFSPIHDDALPENIDGLFLGGGFPETHSQQISSNTTMLHSIKQAIENGLPSYAECGGMMILANTMQYESNTYPMAQVIDAECQMHTRPQGRGYVNVVSKNHPWHVADDQTIHAHEFHYSKLDHFNKDYDFAYHVTRGDGIVNQQDGLHIHNLLASYTHLKHTEQFPWIQYFLDFCQQIKDEG